MTAERSSKSHAMAWTLSLLTVPVLYVLSGPWVLGYAPIPWGVRYFAPYEWLARNTPLGHLLWRYFDWCDGRNNYWFGRSSTSDPFAIQTVPLASNAPIAAGSLSSSLRSFPQSDNTPNRHQNRHPSRNGIDKNRHFCRL